MLKNRMNLSLHDLYLVFIKSELKIRIVQKSKGCCHQQLEHKASNADRIQQCSAYSHSL